MTFHPQRNGFHPWRSSFCLPGNSFHLPGNRVGRRQGRIRPQKHCLRFRRDRISLKMDRISRPSHQTDLGTAIKRRWLAENDPGTHQSGPATIPIDSRFASKRQRTAVATMLPPLCPRASVRDLFFYIAGTADLPSLRLRVLAGGFPDKTAHSRLSLGSARRAAPTLFSIREQKFGSPECSLSLPQPDSAHQ